jgi:peptide/nickel transport system substrate-binding protein
MLHRARSSLAGLVGVALIVTACSSAQSPGATGGTASQSGAATSSPSEGPPQGGTFVGVIPGDPQAGSRTWSTDANTFFAFTPIYSSLVYVDATRTAYPDLAESWDVSEDETVYTFHLRENATFHDGEPVTSEDVRYTVEEVALPYQSQAGPILQNIDTIETPDEHTIIFTLKEPSAVFILGLAHQFMGILPKHLYEGSDPRENPLNETPIGSGPFKFEEWVKGDHITLVRNEDYFLEGLPYLDRVVFRVIPDAGARTIAFQNGDIDFLPGQFVAREQAGELSDVDGVQVDDSHGPPGQELLFMNTTKEPLDNVEVRTAIAMAIDQQAVVDRAFFGVGAKASTSHIEADLGEFHNPDVSLPAYDVDAANTALDDAGYPVGGDGTRFSLSIAYNPGNDSDRRTAELVRDMLGDVGIAVEATPYDLAALADAVWAEDAEFDLFTGSVTSNNDVELGKSRHYKSTTIGQSFGNGAKYHNDEVDSLFNDGASTTDTDVRAEAYWAVQEILAEELPTFPIVDYNNVDFHRPEIGGFGETPLGFPYFRIVNVWRTE